MLLTEVEAETHQMGENEVPANLALELAQTREELRLLRARAESVESSYVELRHSAAPTTGASAEESGHPAVAVLEHIYRDMIAALQVMYRDTIAAKDQALAGQERELETKDALIEHLRWRAEEAEARASQALRYIAEIEAGSPAQSPGSGKTPGRFSLAGFRRRRARKDGSQRPISEIS